MSRPINEDAPLEAIVSGTASIRHSHNTCVTTCGECDTCITYLVKHGLRPVPTPLKSRAEFYQVALREEGEAQEALRKAEAALAIAQEACRDASAQLILTRDGLFKACGL